MKTLKLAILALSFGAFAVSCGDTATETKTETPEVETPATPETPAPVTPEVNPADTTNPAAQPAPEAAPETK
ncbi:MAG: hypothetical protein BGO09_02815 [Bacteroidetes bacterium 47-18]|nr:MAG: hypothetical protein BGO09_02815 [Bacteroidetes bacterium 47-18]